MGYKRKRTIYRLKFEGDLEGLEVCAYGPPLGFLEMAMKMAPLAGRRADDLSAEELALVSRFFGGFAEYLVSWNLENDDDSPVPATLAGLQSQDLGFVMEIVEAWLDSVGEVEAPLAPPSNDGSQFPVASIPMESLSPSPQSLSGPSLSSAAVSGSGASQAS